MQLTSTILLFALGLRPALSQPHRHNSHAHEKRVDYSNLPVDWSKLDYSGGAAKAAPQPAPQPAQPSPQQEQPAVQAEAPKEDTNPPPTQQKNTEPSKDEYKAPSSNAGGSKKGLAYNWETASLDMFKPYAGKSVSWAWNWDSTAFKLPQGFSYVPNLRTAQPDSTGHWMENAKKAIADGSTHLMGFNEPDIPEQANLSPGDAAGKWMQYMQPLAGGNVKLGSPQVSNGVGINPGTGRQMGLGWMKEFMGACSKCTIDFIVVHWYGCTDGCTVDTDVSAFKDFVGKAISAAGGKKIWLTEFATHNPDGVGFMNKVLPWLDGQDGVERYSYFMVKEGVLTSGGGLSALGQTYVG